MISIKEKAGNHMMRKKRMMIIKMMTWNYDDNKGLKFTKKIF